MNEFADDCVDRSWSKAELVGLSERQLTAFVWRKHVRNACFFGPLGIAGFLATLWLGTLGELIGWAGVILFGLFAIHSASGGVLRAIVTFWRPNRWRVLQVLVMFASTTYYSLLLLLLWYGLHS